MLRLITYVCAAVAATATITASQNNTALIVLPPATGSNKNIVGSPVANCGGEFTNVNAILYPSSQLQEGEEAYLYMSYDVPYDVDAGYVLTSVNFNGVPYPEFNSSLCSNSESAITKFLRSPFKYFQQRSYEKLIGLECPLTAGEHTKNSSFSVPNDIGTIKTKIGWFSDTGRLLLCLKIIVDIIPINHRHIHDEI